MRQLVSMRRACSGQFGAPVTMCTPAGAPMVIFCEHGATTIPSTMIEIFGLRGGRLHCRRLQ